MLAADCPESVGGLFFQLLARKLLVGRREDKEPEDAAVDGRLQTDRSCTRIGGISVVRGSPVGNPYFTKSGAFRSDDRPRRSIEPDDGLALRVVSGDDPAQFIDYDGFSSCTDLTSTFAQPESIDALVSKIAGAIQRRCLQGRQVALST
jgi:hypothetical protein